MSAADPMQVLDELDQATLEPFRIAWSEVDGVWLEVRRALESLAAAHRAVVDATGVQLEIPASDRLEAVVAYRREVADKVQRPLLDALDGFDPMGRIREAREGAERRCWDQAAALEAVLTLPWDDAGLAPAETDRVVRRVRTSMVRGLRRVRPSRPRPGVPVRALAHRVIRLEVTPDQRPSFNEAQRSWARWMGALERAWDAWAAHLLRVVASVPPSAPARDEEDVLGAEEQSSAVLAAIEALQEALDDALTIAPHAEAEAKGMSALARAGSVFVRELSLAGTGALSLASEANAPPKPAARPDVTWEDWYVHAVNRFALHRVLLDVVLGAESAVGIFADSVEEHAGGELPTRCAHGAGQLRQLAAQLGERPGPGLAGRLARVRPEAEKAVSEGLAALPEITALRAFIESSADVLSQSIHALAQMAPTELKLHELPEDGASFAKPAEPRTVKLGEISRRTFDVLRMEKIRTSPLPLVERVTEVVVTGTGIHDVVAYGLDSAESELSGGGEEEGAGDRALTLAREGLRRAADALAGLPEHFEKAVGETRIAVERETARGCARLIDRGLAQGVQIQFLDARSTLRHQFGEFQERWTPALHRAGLRVGTEWRRVRGLLAKLLRRGRTMVGTTSSAQTGYRAGKLLADTGTQFGVLPLVYQRLYSLNPVTDSALLVGRESILAEIEQRVAAWRDEDGIPLVVYARPGVGISSLFLVLMGRMEAQGTRVVHHTLNRRYRDEAEFATHLAALMGLPAAGSLNELSETILGAPKGKVPDLVALEELEYLYLRAPGGTDLVERLLTFMSETEPRVFWLASTTQSAWQLVRKSEPSAVSQVEAVELPPLDAEQIRLAILARHRRSGVPLEYEEPSEGRHLLRRRLRRIKGQEGRRAILERDFFAKLHHASGGNIGLALYHWLRSADFTSVPGELRVRPVESADLSFLDGLDLNQNFTLKALLEHRTLTLDEHDAIFRLPRQESFQIMESLLNRYLVEPVRASDGNGAPVGAEQDVRRYRIIPLLAAAVASHLAARNIVH